MQMSLAEFKEHVEDLYCNELLLIEQLNERGIINRDEAAIFGWLQAKDDILSILGSLYNFDNWVTDRLPFTEDILLNKELSGGDGREFMVLVEDVHGFKTFSCRLRDSKSNIDYDNKDWECNVPVVGWQMLPIVPRKNEKKA